MVIEFSNTCIFGHLEVLPVLYKRLWYLTRIVCFSQNALILVRKSIFENPVLIDIVLACRNKCRAGHLALIGLGLVL